MRRSRRSTCSGIKHDEHLREAPVVIGLDQGVPLEVCANKFADLSITRGLIDLRIGVKWDWDEEPWLFEWRRDHVPGIRCVLGQRVLAVEVIENELVMGRGRAWCLGVIELVTVNGALSVFNGLDDTQVGMSREPEGWRRVARPNRGS